MLSSENLQKKSGTVVVVQDALLEKSTSDLVKAVSEHSKTLVHMIGFPEKEDLVQKMNDMLESRYAALKAVKEELSEFLLMKAEREKELESDKEDMNDLEVSLKQASDMEIDLLYKLEQNNKFLEPLKESIEIKMTKRTELFDKVDASILSRNSKRNEFEGDTKKFEKSLKDSLDKLNEVLKESSTVSAESVNKNAEKIVDLCSQFSIPHLSAKSKKGIKDSLKPLCGLFPKANISDSFVRKLGEYSEMAMYLNRDEQELNNNRAALDKLDEAIEQDKIDIQQSSTLLNALVAKKEVLDQEFNKLDADRKEIVGAGAVFREELTKLAEKGVSNESTLNALTVVIDQKQKEVDVMDKRYQSLKEHALSVSTQSTTLSNVIDDFVSQVQSVSKLDKLQDLSLSNGNHVVIVRTAEEAEAVVKKFGDEFEVHKFEPVVHDSKGFNEQLQDLNISKIYIEHQPKYEGDKPMDKSSEVANSNLDPIKAMVSKVCANSVLFAGGALDDANVNKLLSTVSRELGYGYRGVGVSVPLLSGEKFAMFKLGSAEKAGTHFNLSIYNEGKDQKDQIKGVQAGDSLLIVLTPENIAAIEKWNGEKSFATKLVGTVSSYQLCA